MMSEIKKPAPINSCESPETKPPKIAVIGGGPSGMTAASFAAKAGADVTIFEKNPFFGKKLLITGKGRCNVTNDTEPREFMESVVRGKKFLLSSIYGFSPEKTKELFSSLGVELKTERGKRVFPASDNARDIRDALKRLVEKNRVKTVFQKVNSIELCDKAFTVASNGKKTKFDKVIIATGGLSYPLTGSTGDGYEFAKKFGHTVTKLSGSLNGLICRESFVGALEGLSLKNVKVSLFDKNKCEYSDQGEMLFTDRGVSGPLILSASALVEDSREYALSVDLKPALTHEALDKRVLSDFGKNSNRDLINSLDGLLPKRLIPVIVEMSGIEPRKKVNSITKDERKSLVSVLKNLELTVCDKEPIDRAVVTRGGIELKEVDPKTMESKIIKGLYFCGEILDADALTGGFNLQIAFATGFAAGTAAAKRAES